MLRAQKCCGAASMSDLGTVIGIACYFVLGQNTGRFRGSIFGENTMGCLLQPLNLTLKLLHNIGFPKAGGPRIQKLHLKSIYCFGLLNFLNPIPCQATISCCKLDIAHSWG